MEHVPTFKFSALILCEAMYYNFDLRENGIFYTPHINLNSLGYVLGTDELKISVA